MNRLSVALLVASSSLSACGGPKTPQAPTTPTASAPAQPAGAPAPAPAPTPAPTPAPAPAADPFATGSCEVTIAGEAPKKTPGGAANVSTMYWAGPATKNPSWPLLINCGSFNLSGEGDATTFPMKPATYPILTAAKDGVAHFTLLAPLVVEGGEVAIEAWDMLGIRGTFEVKARRSGEGGAPVAVKGAFDFKCPYTKPGEPCLSKPATP